MRRLLQNLLTTAVFTAAANAFAFGAEGHMTVGTIADALLQGTPAGKQARKILGSSLRTASVWADCVRGVDEKTFQYGASGKFPECEIYERSDASKEAMQSYVRRNVQDCPVVDGETCHRQYHYTNISIQRSAYAPGPQGTSPRDVVAAINAMILVLQDRQPPASFRIAGKKEALRLLAHFVGDIHQPLHAGSIYLDREGKTVDPDNGSFDGVTKTTGGNDLLLRKPQPGEKVPNLHGMWDGVRGPVPSLPLPAPLLQEARAVAATPGPIEGWAARWATESLLEARKAFEGVRFEALDPDARKYLVLLPDGYAEKRERVQHQRMVEAGARLAQILTAIWP